MGVLEEDLTWLESEKQDGAEVGGRWCQCGRARDA
jgi:hypothetical protein